MKINYKKIATVLASTLMLGSTIAVASAAWSASANDYAVVYGSNNDATDLKAATDIANALTVSSSTTTTSGSTKAIEGNSQKFWLGSTIGGVLSKTLNVDDMPDVLADGVFVNDASTEYKYTQKITLNQSMSLTLFDDNDYAQDTPTVGIKLNAGSNVLNYTLDFTDNTPLTNDIEKSTIKLMGKEYYVLDQQNGSTTSLTLLDSAMSQVISEGSEKTLTASNGKTYSVKVDSVDSNGKTRLIVDGKTTSNLAEGSTYKLGNNSYLGVKYVTYKSKESQVSQVELTLGTGKLVLSNATDIEMNDDTINGLQAFLYKSGSDLDKIVLVWNTDDEMFVTKNTSITMPGFNIVKISTEGMILPTAETTKIVNNGRNVMELQTKIKDGDVTIPLVRFTESSSNGSIIATGEASDKLLRTGANSIVFDGDTDYQFVASYLSGTDAESYLLYATSFVNDSSIEKATIKSRVGSFSKQVQAGDQVDIGMVSFTVNYVNKTAKTIAITKVGNTNFEDLYTKSGLYIALPSTYTYNGTAYTALSIPMVEEDKDGNIASGSWVNVTTGVNSNGYAQVSGISSDNFALGGVWNAEIGTSKEYIDYVKGPLATEVLFDQDADQDVATINYFGDEVSGKVYVSTPGAVSTNVQTANAVMDSALTDADKAKNLIVIGGSCINAVARKALFGVDTPVCGSEFTTKTGVAAGKYLVQVAKNPYTQSKMAVILAGYDAAQTTDAAKYFLEGNVNVSAESKLVGPVQA